MVEQIKRFVHDDETVNTLADLVMELQGRENTVLPYLQQQLDEINAGIDNLVNAIQMGIFNEATKKRMDKLVARKADIEIQIAKEEIAKPKLTRDQVCCYLYHFRTFDTNNFEHRRRFIDAFINRIFLYDDKLVITFNVKNKTRTVTFAELEASGILSELAINGEPKRKNRAQYGSFFFTCHCALKHANLPVENLFGYALPQNMVKNGHTCKPWFQSPVGELKRVEKILDPFSFFHAIYEKYTDF